MLDSNEESDQADMDSGLEANNDCAAYPCHGLQAKAYR